MPGWVLAGPGRSPGPAMPWPMCVAPPRGSQKSARCLHSARSTLDDQSSEGGPAGLAPFVRFHPQLQVRHTLRQHRPVFALKGRTRRAEGVVLTAQLTIALPAIVRDRQAEFLRATDLK